MGEGGTKAGGSNNRGARGRQAGGSNNRGARRSGRHNRAKGMRDYVVSSYMEEGGVCNSSGEKEGMGGSASSGSVAGQSTQNRGVHRGHGWHMASLYNLEAHMQVLFGNTCTGSAGVCSCSAPCATQARSAVLYCTVLYCTVLYCTTCDAGQPHKPLRALTCIDGVSNCECTWVSQADDVTCSTSTSHHTQQHNYIESLRDAPPGGCLIRQADDSYGTPPSNPSYKHIGCL
jgi:hypothetical protein